MKTRFLLLLSMLYAGLALADKKLAFEFKDSDRVVFLGDTLMEREQYYGYIELALASHSPERKVTFRNLGWSADTPEGVSRAGLSKLQAGTEPADEGWNQLLDQLELTKPTVVLLGYGMANSFDGEKGLHKFVGDMNKLIDTIQKKYSGVRFVLLSPIQHENLGAPLPDPTAHNKQLQLYANAIAEIARQRGFPFVSLFDHLKVETKRKASHPLTDNGIHLNALGYQKVAETIVKDLGWKSRNSNVSRAEAARREILKKNEIFFNRSRPQNMAYLLGFRKAEQGRNAAELPMFDPLLEAEDAKIHRLLKGEESALSLRETGEQKKSARETKKFEPQPAPKLDLAPELEVNLFAESPVLAKPIQMNFDPQGRLWLACSSVYPQIAPGQEPEDKILVIEDTDGDGKADKSTVFADGLLVPTAVEPGDGGVYVGQSTELLFFKDTDGDGKADERKVVLCGFGTEDSHHNIHTLRWGPDGNLYFNQSIYIRTDTETPNGVVRLKSGGILQLKPASTALEIFVRGFCNTWGHAFDAYGQSFITDGCGSQGISYGLPGATYWTYAGLRRELKSISPGSYPKFCGLETLRSEHFPADWQDNLITSDFRGHRVVRFKITEQGAGFAAQEMPELIRSTDNTFRPIDAKVGPDGALYIADWSNPIINHGEVDFRDPRRDHDHGRVWRVTCKGRPLVPKPKLASAKNEELLNQLLSPNDFNRNQARRVLTERGPKIEKDLAKWTAKQTDEKAMLEGLWVQESIGKPDYELLLNVLVAKDAKVRAAGVRVLASCQNQMPRAPELLAIAIADSHPRVRLEAVRALSRIPSARSAELVLSTLDQPIDSFLDYAVWLSINDLAQPWAEAVKTGAWRPDGREKQLEFALKAIEPALATSVLEKVLANREIPRDGSGPWIELIGQSGGIAELQRLYQHVLKGGFSDTAAVRALNALNEAARLRSLKPAKDRELITQLLTAESSRTQAAAVRLAGVWKIENASDALFNIALDSATPDNLRHDVFDSLREIGGTPVEDRLTNLLANDDHPLLRQSILVTLASLNLDKAMPHIVSALTKAGDEENAIKLWRSLLNVKDASKRIARNLPKELPLSVAKAGVKAARENGRNEADLVLALSRSANLSDADKELTAEELKQLAASVTEKGDAARGEMIYRKAEVGCMNCHSIGGAGGKVGPDMTSIGASAPLDYLIESVLYPNKKIKEGFHSIQVQTKDDQEYSGIFVRETDQELVLRDATNKEISIPKNKIENRKTGLSLMPSGLAENLSDEERVDLFRFLSELGKPGAFDASKGNVARVWRLFPLNSRQEQFGTDKLVGGDLSVPGWTPVFATVNGRLLKNDLETQLNTLQKGSRLGLFALARLQLASAHKVRLKLSGLEKPELWIDGKPFANSGAEVELSQGKHVIVVRIEAQNLPEQLRLETNEGTFLTD